MLQAMSDPASRRMTVAEFLEWELEQEGRHELVDGVPQLVNGVPQAMTGARFSHDRVVINVIFALTRLLRANGNPCDVFSADIAVVVPSGNVRRPDVAVHCPPFDDRAAASDHPKLVVEVLSESTQTVDQVVKLDEYQAIPQLDYILFIAPTRREVGVWSRGVSTAWQHTVLRAADAVIGLDVLGIVLPVADIYERVTLREESRPHLVWPDEGGVPEY